MSIEITLDRLRDANPTPDPDRLEFDDQGLLAMIDEKTTTAHRGEMDGGRVLSLQKSTRAAFGWWVAAAVFISIVSVGIVLALVTRFGGQSQPEPVVTTPPTTAAVTTTVEPDVTTPPTTLAGSTGLFQSPLDAAEAYAATFNDRDLDGFLAIWSSNPSDQWTGVGYFPHAEDFFLFWSDVFSIQLTDCESTSTIRAQCGVTITDAFLELVSEEGPIEAVWEFNLDSQGRGELQSINTLVDGNFDSPAWDDFAIWQNEEYPDFSQVYNRLGRRPLGQPVEDVLAEWWGIVDEYAAELGISR